MRSPSRRYCVEGYADEESDALLIHSLDRLRVQRLWRPDLELATLKREGRPKPVTWRFQFIFLG